MMGNDNGANMSPQDQRNAELMEAIHDLGLTIAQCRPGDRSELDHAYSVLLTEWKKMRAWVAAEIFMPFESLENPQRKAGGGDTRHV